MGIREADLSLEGLSIGDAFGELFYSQNPDLIENHLLPTGPWRWTDDTHMALSIIEVLKLHGRIHQEALAQCFARRHHEEPWRGYAGGAHRLLTHLHSGARWQEEAPALFSGGSYGNGGAMRAAPIGGFYAGDPERAAEEAGLSAMITHAHLEGQAGAMAVAAAAALAAQPAYPRGDELLNQVMEYTPSGETRAGIALALQIPAGSFQEAARRLGTGEQVSAQDTVPFCLWVAAHHMDDYETALWQAAGGLGDVDTTCAIVGGIVALSARRIPAEWMQRREALPQGFGAQFKELSSNYLIF